MNAPRGMPWAESWRADPIARVLADRHYNRQRIGHPQFVPPGACVVLRTLAGDAFWVSSLPIARYVRHEWAGAWMCSAFRLENGPLTNGPLASEAITAAVAATLFVRKVPPPAEGFVTFIDPRKVPGFIRRSRHGPRMEWGYSYFKAGWRHVGWTKGGLFVRQLPPFDFPPAAAPLRLPAHRTAARPRGG